MVSFGFRPLLSLAVVSFGFRLLISLAVVSCGPAFPFFGVGVKFSLGDY